MIIHLIGCNSVRARVIKKLSKLIEFIRMHENHCVFCLRLLIVYSNALKQMIIEHVITRLNKICHLAIEEENWYRCIACELQS